MNVVLAAFLIGVIAGLRAMMAPTVVSWAAGLGTLHLEGTPLHFWGHVITRYVLSVAAIGELINDKLPKTPSRKIPPQFIVRVLTGGLSGAALGAARQATVVGLVAGAIGAVVGTLGGSEFRTRLGKALGKDLPAALIEDVIAIVGAVLIVTRF